MKNQTLKSKLFVGRTGDSADHETLCQDSVKFGHVGKSLLEPDARTNVPVRILTLTVLPLMLDSALITVMDKTCIL